MAKSKKTHCDEIDKNAAGIGALQHSVLQMRDNKLNQQLQSNFFNVKF
jgi:hypothetical protein